MATFAFAPGAPIVVAGDSISKGISFDESRGRHVVLRDGFCARVSSHLSRAVENISRFGVSSGEVLRTLRVRLLKGPTPALVLLEVGGNDCDFDWNAIAENPGLDHQPNTTLKEYEHNLNDIVEAVRASGSQLVLCNLPPIDAERYFRFFTGGDREKGEHVLRFIGSVGRIYWWHERYNATLEWVAQSTHTPMLMLRGAMLREEDYRAYISEDGLHPNARGHARMAEITMQYVQKYAPTLLTQ